MTKLPKIIRLSTIGLTLNVLLKGQLKYLNQEFELTAISTQDDDLKKVQEREGVRTIGVDMARGISIFNDLVALLKLYKIFKTENPDIIHSNTPKSSLLSMIAGYFAGINNRVYTVTGIRYQTEKGLKRWILKSMEKITASFATVVIPEGPGVKQFLIEENITSKSLNVLGSGSMCGVDLNKYSDRNIDTKTLHGIKDAISYRPDLTYILAVGRLVKDKGIEELVNVFVSLYEEYPDLRLVLLGPHEKNLDPLSIEIEKIIGSNPNIFHIHWSDDVEYYIYVSDMLVHASYREGFPNVLLQAGAMACPVICSNIPGNSDIVKDGRTGVCFDAGDIQDLENKLKYSLQNRDIIQSFAEKLKSEVASKYSTEHVRKGILSFYKSLLSD